MTRQHASSLRFPALLLAACLLWLAAGSPLRGAEWADLPSAAVRMLVQIPARMGRIFSCWFGGTSLVSSAQAETRQVDLTLRVWDDEIGAVRSLSLEDYVTGVVASEMPASYGLEALRCQAVAARTRAVFACRSLGGNGCVSHSGCDLCTDPACCQGWLGRQARQERFGNAWQACEARIACAVRTTAGQILTWNGLPIEVMYHACSGGMTEDASAVFSQSVPYLASVSSPGEESYAGFTAQVRMSFLKACGLLEAAFPGCGVTEEELSTQLKVLSSTSSGRIAAMLVGSKTVTGAQFRQALSLRSTLCTWDTDGSDIVFTTRGYGHGVGMSQAGAQAMDAAGSGYQDILSHYYPGTVLALLPDLHEEGGIGSN